MFVPQRRQERIVYESPWLRVKQANVTMPDGQTAHFELRDEPDVAVCLPVAAAGQIILIEEYRHGPQRYLCEIPGGGVDPGEDPMAAARREALEETGYLCQPHLLATGWVGAYSSARKHIFIAHAAEEVAHPVRGENDLFEVRGLSLTQFQRVVDNGELTDLDAGVLCLANLHAVGLG